MFPQLDHEHGALLTFPAQLVADIGMTERLQIEGTGKGLFDAADIVGLEERDKALQEADALGADLFSGLQSRRRPRLRHSRPG